MVEKSSKTYTRLLVYFIVFLFLTGAISTLSLQKIKKVERQSLEQTLKTVMRTTRGALQNWIDEQFKEAKLLAIHPLVTQPTEELLKVHIAGGDLRHHPLQSQLKNFIGKWIDGEDAQGYLISTPDGTCLSSMREQNIGTISSLAKRTEFFKKTLEGKSEFVLPFSSAIRPPDSDGKLKQGDKTMFVTVPILGKNNTVIAIFSIGMAPNSEFSRIPHLARSGSTGDFYLLNVHGEFISSGRFDGELVKLQLIDHTETPIYSLKVRDPGGDLSKGYKPPSPANKWPLTRMARSVVEGKAGINLDGYRDYRGVGVVGIWEWNEKYRFGLSYEIDVTDAFATYHSIRDIVLFSTSIFSFLFLVMLRVVHKKNSAALEANKILAESEKKFSTVTEAITDAIIMIDEKDAVRFWNKGAEKLFGLNQDEAEGKEIHSLIIPERLRNQALIGIKNFQKSGEGLVVGTTRELIAIRSGENEFPVEVSNSPIQVGDKWWAVGVVRDISVRKEREKSLEKNKRLLQEAQSIAHLGHWEVDLTNGTLLWSDEVYRIFGLQPQNVLPSYELFLEMIHHDDREAVNKAYKDSIAEHAPYSIEHRIVLEDGTEKHVHEQGMTEYSEDGVAIRSFGTVLDISERIRQQKEVQGLTDRMQLAANAAGLGVWDLNVRDKNLHWDASMFELYGIAKNEFEEGYETWEKYIHPADVDRVAEELQLALLGEGEFDTVFRIIKPQEGIRHLKANATVHRDEQNKPLRVVGVNYDITDQTEAELALKEINEELEQRIQERTQELEKSKKAAMSIMQDAYQSKKKAEEALVQLKTSQNELIKLSKAIESSQVSVVITDVDGVIEYVNPKFSEVTGYSTQEALGSKPNVLKSDEQPESFYKEMWNEILAGKKWHGEFCNKHKDGTIFWERASISPIFDEEGQMTHFVAVKEDITEKKKAEKNLVRALAKAEEATKAKSDFLANMSHEIRTPMNAIIGMSHLMMQTALTDRQQDYLGNISFSAKSLLNTINDILDFSKIEAGKLEIEATVFNISQVVENVVVQNATKIGEKGVELLLTLDEEIPRVLVGDPIRITQILSNLLSNAAKFTKKGEIEVSVSAIDKGDGEVVLECSVSDSGIGMREEEANKIFQQFSQADSSTTRKYGGTGLGLSICKQLVELMGGNIWVESIPGKGSKFIFRLRLQYREDRRKKQVNVLPLNLRNLKVLLVDQNSKNLIRLTSLLQSLSFSVESIRDAGQALKIFKKGVAEKKPHELVVVDYKSYQAKRARVLAMLRSIRELEQVPVIFMANVTEMFAVEEILQARKMAQAVQKPVTPSALFNSIAEAFGYTDLSMNRREGKRWVDRTRLEFIKGARILLVEDNRMNQKVAKELLNHVHLNVTVANDGKEAVSYIEKEQFDLVLMDIQMPVMDGISAARIIRKLPGKAKGLPIVAMTAHAMAGDKEKSLKAGMNAHITKPIEPGELHETLVRWIQPLDIASEQGRGKVTSNNMRVVSSKGATEKLAVLINGVNVEAGLTRVAGNTKLYFQLLQDFLSENEHFDKMVKEALHSSDTQTAMRLVHTLKGVAGNIGAYDLQEKAAQLEFAISKDSGITTILEETVKNVKKLIREIQGAQAEFSSVIAPKPPAVANVDRATQIVKIGKLVDLLKISDMGAETLFHELRDALYLASPEKTERLEEALTSFDFKRALEMLNRIKDDIDGEVHRKGETA